MSEKFEYSIKSHPTIYKGVQFRSRLEATYAAFFDLLEWEWEYEPIDLEGWSPDFRIKVPSVHRGDPYTNVEAIYPDWHDEDHFVNFVEIKPYSQPETYLNSWSPFEKYITNFNDAYLPCNGIMLMSDHPRKALLVSTNVHFVRNTDPLRGYNFHYLSAKDRPDIDLFWKASRNTVQYLAKSS